MEITGTHVESFKNSNMMMVKVSPADLKAQLKPTKAIRIADKVWVEAKVKDLPPDGFIGIVFQDCRGVNCNHSAGKKDIIAAFPAEAELPEKFTEEEMKAENVSHYGVKAMKIINYLLEVVKEMMEKK